MRLQYVSILMLQIRLAQINRTQNRGLKLNPSSVAWLGIIRPPDRQTWRLSDMSPQEHLLVDVMLGSPIAIEQTNSYNVLWSIKGHQPCLGRLRRLSARRSRVITHTSLGRKPSCSQHSFRIFQISAIFGSTILRSASVRGMPCLRPPKRRASMGFEARFYLIACVVVELYSIPTILAPYDK